MVQVQSVRFYGLQDAQHSPWLFVRALSLFSSETGRTCLEENRRGIESFSPRTCVENYFGPLEDGFQVVKTRLTWWSSDAGIKAISHDSYQNHGSVDQRWTSAHLHFLGRAALASCCI